jgi:hypothetical protein
MLPLPGMSWRPVPAAYARFEELVYVSSLRSGSSVATLQVGSPGPQEVGGETKA